MSKLFKDPEGELGTTSVNLLLGRCKTGPWGPGDASCTTCSGEGYDVNCGGQIEKCRCLIDREVSPTRSVFVVGDRVRKRDYKNDVRRGYVARVHEPELVGGILQPQMVTVRWDGLSIPSTIPARWCTLEVRFGSIPEQSTFERLIRRVRALLAVERSGQGPAGTQ